MNRYNGLKQKGQAFDNKYNLSEISSISLKSKVKGKDYIK